MIKKYMVRKVNDEFKISTYGKIGSYNTEFDDISEILYVVEIETYLKLELCYVEEIVLSIIENENFDKLKRVNLILELNGCKVEFKIKKTKRGKN